MKNYPSRRNNDLGFGWFDNAFDDFFRPFYGWDRMPAMKTDIQEKDGKYLLEVDLPGYDKKDINVSLEDGYLTVSAAKGLDKDEQDQKGKYIRQERYAGAMSRSFYIGEEVSQDEIRAKYENGILRLTIPKKDAKPAVEEKKHIAIEG